MQDHQDKWWTLSDESSYTSIETEVRRVILNIVIRIINEHMTEQGLITLWESEKPGSFEYPRLREKSILLAAQNKFEELPDIFHRIREICRETRAQSGAEEHIAKLKAHYSLPFC